MKIRTGFVGNSSSSSFLIYGTCFNTSTLEDHGHEDLDSALSDFQASKPDRPDIKKLSMEYGPDSSYCQYVGRSWDSIADDETGKEFKESVQQCVQEFMSFMGFSDEEIAKTSIETHEEGWYNG